MMESHATPDPGLTVDALMISFPATMPVFNAHGIDICCGAGNSLRVAAERDGADLDRLLADLAAAIGAAG
jgi:iron-sulfur cluster repair protein YtfE (RIC family)